MQWRGFGRGFAYDPESLAINVWSPQARAASAAARKASAAAHAATPKGNLLERVLMGGRFTRTSPTYSVSGSAMGSAKAAASGKALPYTTPAGEHEVAAMSHEIAAKELRQDGKDKIAVLHDKAAKLHYAAAKIHSSGE